MKEQWMDYAKAALLQFQKEERQFKTDLQEKMDGLQKMIEEENNLKKEIKTLGERIVQQPSDQFEKTIQEDENQIKL